MLRSFRFLSKFIIQSSEVSLHTAVSLVFPQRPTLTSPALTTRHWPEAGLYTASSSPPRPGLVTHSWPPPAS